MGTKSKRFERLYDEDGNAVYAGRDGKITAGAELPPKVASGFGMFPVWIEISTADSVRVSRVRGHHPFTREDIERAFDEDIEVWDL